MSRWTRLNAVATQAEIAGVNASATQVLTNKSVDLAANTLTGTTAQFNTALSDNDFATVLVSTVTSTTTLAAAAGTIYAVFIGAGGVPTFPTAVGNRNLYKIKNVDTTNKTISTTSSQTIDGSTTITLTPNTSVDLVSDGANWMVL